MKPGKLVTIYYTAHDSWTRIIDKVGLLVAIVGKKADVMVDGEIEVWDIRDLVKMELDKNESR